ncbi:hypothetical protein [Natronococcus sp. A-GB7]|uniref:hypothetical protein n=1 Tax=Natronococcus sp. A-GB7 TaxID=3037649 RepID=UPI00241F043C|nr:hypothetical protein [Natronococcus sp. A-GB7]MDG5821326.1 hypothetical protein [Natronococcus sp. A-GB7]
MSSTSIVTKRYLHLILSFCYLSIFVGVLVAYNAPAQGYEVSIYSKTPTVVWALILLPLLTSLSMLLASLSSVFSIGRNHESLLLFTSFFTVVTVVALPLIRGYRHVGEGDMLSHVGIAMDIKDGLTAPLDLFYPLSHVLSITISVIGSLDLFHSYSILSLVIATLFPLFIGLCARTISDNYSVLAVGFLSGLLYIPIDHISTHLQPAPRNIALFLSPAALFFLLKAIKGGNKKNFLLFSLVCLSLLLFHPQMAAMLAMTSLLLAISLYILDNSYVRNPMIENKPSPLIFSFFLATVAWVWIGYSDQFESSLGRIAYYIFSGTASAGSGGAAERGASLAAVGGSVEEIFIKLFLAGAVFGVSSVLYLLWGTYTNHSNKKKSHNPLGISIGTGLLIGGVPVFLVTVAYLIINDANQAVRYVGFLLVIVSIIGSVAIGDVLHYTSSKSLKSTLSILIVIFMLMSVLVIHPSPYVFQDSEHVTESQLAGFEISFEYTDDANFDHVRSSVDRYGDAILGSSGRDSSDYYHSDVDPGGVPNHFAHHDLENHYNESTYLAITEADRIRDPVVYNGLRFDHNDFNYLDNTPYIQRIHSNAGHDLYFVQSSEQQSVI